MTDFPAQDLYQIGSVTALTGIAAERLRAWERRYGFTPAEKKGKIRQNESFQKSLWFDEILLKLFLVNKEIDFTVKTRPRNTNC